MAPLFVAAAFTFRLQAPLRLSNVKTLTLGDDVVVSGQMPSAVDCDVAPVC